MPFGGHIRVNQYRIRQGPNSHVKGLAGSRILILIANFLLNVQVKNE